jgi:L-threonylcarbamoyladenylate synthase
MESVFRLSKVERDRVKQARESLLEGGVVAFPTETSYGLGASVNDRGALDRIYEIKKRPAEKPLLVIVDSRERMTDLVTEIPPAARRLMERFWPGPLTILFPAVPGLAWPLHCGTGRVGIRISSNPWAYALAAALGKPLTATSANLSGRLPAVSAREVREQLVSPAPDYILDGGRLNQGACSTIVDVTAEEGAEGEHGVCVIRKGVIAPEEIYA